MNILVHILNLVFLTFLSSLHTHKKKTKSKLLQDRNDFIFSYKTYMFTELIR